ncbi:D-arabinono-1,4-lactone oxidase [Lecanora helva]
MDFELELSRVDPEVPFRAITDHTHHTWARTFYSYPEIYIQPHTTEELGKVVRLARRCRRRIVVTGCGHSPSDLTCTSSWLVNLDRLDELSDVDKDTSVVIMQAGIRLHDLWLKLKQHGLSMPNIGSIDHQSIAGAIATATHGSSTRHGILSQSVRALRIMLANGRVVPCSPEQNSELFRAALVSLGALGIIVEVTFQAVPAFDIEWVQSLHPLDEIISDWEKGLWRQKEFTRVWWMPYMKRCMKWRADKTDKPRHPPVSNWWNGRIGFHTYHLLLYCAQWIPSILPLLERFVINVQYGFKNGAGSVAVEEGRTGLLMNCLYSQFVNEWAIPLEKGPEALTRLSCWLNGDDEASGMPFSSKGLYVHSPIEVRVCDTSSTTPRPYLDNTMPDGPTLYLNATLYRPYNRDPPCRQRYYEAFEWLMKEYGGRPHWAKNFSTVTKDEFHAMYPEMRNWIRIRNDVDPDGMFVGDWHRRYLLPDKDDTATLPLEEKNVRCKPALGGGSIWTGCIPGRNLSPQGSEESFEMMHEVEAEKSEIRRHDMR